MGENTKIAWCDHTFNPWIGCTKVSSGCDNCYAEREFDNRHHRAVWGVGHPRVRTSATNWNLPLRWNRKARAAIAVGLPRPRVFCASLGDVFDNEVPDVWREELFELIRITPNLDWLLLTKRPQNIVKMVKLHGAIAGNGSRYLPDNVWLGATCENQARANVNVPHLLVTRKELGAKCLFLSVEPMLGSIDLTNLRCEIDLGEGMPWLDAIRGLVFDGNGDSNSCPHIDWVICGGESGPHARPMHPDWVRGLRNQCAEAGVPFFFKQWGEYAPICNMNEDAIDRCYKSIKVATGEQNQEDVDDAYGRKCTVKETVLHVDGSEYDITHPNAFLAASKAMTMMRVGKAASGNLLDGDQHHAWPEVRS